MSLISKIVSIINLFSIIAVIITDIYIKHFKIKLDITFNYKY